MTQQRDPKEVEEALDRPVELTRGVHVVVAFRGVMDSRPANGVARIRVKGMPGWIALVPPQKVMVESREEE